MYLSDMVIDRGQDEIRESKIQEMLKSGKLKVHPDLPKIDGRGRSKKLSDNERLDLVMKMADRTVSMRVLGRDNNVSPKTFYDCRDEYLAGELGPVDAIVVEKLS